MSNDRFDIQELTSETGIPRRTIYFYVQQGLLPPPQGAGLAAFYTEDHLLRLRLIPILRKQGLRLDVIREKFQEMSPEEMRQVVESARKPVPMLAESSMPLPQAPLPGWGEQRYTHYSFPGGITLTAPEKLNMTDRQRLNQLLQAAWKIFGGQQPIYTPSGQVRHPSDTIKDENPKSS